MRIVGFKLHITSVGYKLVDHRRRRLRVERNVAAESRYENVRAHRGNAWNVLPQNPHVASFHNQFFDSDELESIRTMAELNSFNDAAGREVSGMEVPCRDRAVTGIPEILQHGVLRVGPEFDVEDCGQNEKEASDGRSCD